mgnify:FL=1
MKNTNETFAIKGIISAERPCECCGNTNLEKNVVLERLENGELMYVGTSCAGELMLGKKTSKNTKRIASEAAAHNYANKWVAKYGSSEDVLQKIASAIRARYCPAHVVWVGRSHCVPQIQIG